jgi:hypothetical protein
VVNCCSVGIQGRDVQDARWVDKSRKCVAVIQATYRTTSAATPESNLQSLRVSFPDPRRGIIVFSVLPNAIKSFHVFAFMSLQ